MSLHVRSLLVLFLGSLLPTVAHSQTRSAWVDIIASEVVQTRGERYIAPAQARYVRAIVEALRAELASAATGTILQVRQAQSLISLPAPEGGMAQFRILEVPVMHPDLQARYPMIRTYSGVGVDDAAVTLKLDITPNGIHAMVTSAERKTWFIDPVLQGDVTLCQVYQRDQLTRSPSEPPMTCSYDQENDIAVESARTREWIQQMGIDRVGDCQMRTYRLALACTGEYANFHGSNSTNNDKSFALGAMVTTMNRVNDMFERDATLTMEMVGNTDLLVFLNGATDPYDDGDGSAMLGQNQTQCTNLIGSANYDIGHVFSTGGGGIASLNSPCSSSNKARGVTGQGSPIGDAFDIDYVAHEMGHQYGGNHTQNNSCNRASSAAVEVGSGITIMGYAGICAPNVGDHSIAMFGGYSMQEIAANITTGTSSTCPVTVSLAPEVAPQANAGVDRVIPKSTPFILTGSGTDANAGNTLTYSWEQMDNAVATMPPVSTNTGGPAWEPLLPKPTPVRYMPDLSAVIANTTPTWQVLSSVARTLSFRLTVRDNLANGGCNDQDDMKVTVNGASGPFLVTQPNTNLSWVGLSTQTVTWDVANTTASPVSCANVDILLSTDGGLTYTTTILTATPNDGSQSITVPNIATTTARIMVRANANIFYDISNTDFTITVPASPDYTLGVTSNTASVCRPANATYSVQVGSVLGYSEPVTLSASGLPAGAVAGFSPNPVTPGGTSTLTLSNTNGVALGAHAFTLNESSTSGPKNLALTLNVSTLPSAVALDAPANGAVDFSGPLSWIADPAASTYTVTIASDAGMTNVVETGSGITGTSFQPVIANVGNTTYHWQVRAENGCGNGPLSVVRSYTTADCQLVTVKINMDRYGNEITWSVVDGSSNVMASGGPYTQEASSGTYPQPDVVVCLPNGCYTLIVNDSYGDGLCCSSGNGSIAVVDPNGFVLAATPSAFTTVANVAFCSPATCVSALPYAEDFETGLGLWDQGVDDDIDWTRNSGGTQSSNTGPSADHSTGSGNYMYVESSDPNFPTKRADLVGPCFDLTGLATAELTFWYHMYGAAMGDLHVDVWDGGVWTMGVLTISGDQGNSWQPASVDLDGYVGGSIRVRFRAITGTNYTSDVAIDDIQLDGASPQDVQLDLKAWLEGPYDIGQMDDSLRFKNMLPLVEPYTDLGFVIVGDGGETTTSGVFAVTGSNAIVDWVQVELRSSADPTIIIATRAGLIQRDGDVVDVDGVSPLSFPIASGDHHIALRHRNHLGVMTANTFSLGGTVTSVDLRSGAVTLYGTEAVKDVSGAKLLWSGNCFPDDRVMYTGDDNDRDEILQRILGTVPTNTVTGYFIEDLNLDGIVKYTGAINDRDIILSNIGGVVPTNVRNEQLP
ncbi:MAG: choice-of-anchor J domain-containing protein [Flavobacteriales bacterium]|nr:choice-of-anchor J domain-containing protein [Flavobacteriales bacterium]